MLWCLNGCLHLLNYYEGRWHAILGQYQMFTANPTRYLLYCIMHFIWFKDKMHQVET